VRSPCYAPGVKRPSIAIVGMGRLGTALAKRLADAGYDTTEVISRKARSRAAEVNADLIWFCVSDSEIAQVTAKFADSTWKGRIAFHSSGALTSEVLAPLRRKGADLASVHPLMTFVRGSVPELAGVFFAIEGDKTAVRVARSIVYDLGGTPAHVRKRDKVAYHAFATMICPLLVSLLVSSEKAAGKAGISTREARRRMMPIIRQTLANYEKLGPAGAFSGPIVRGDSETIRKHLAAMQGLKTVKCAYAALAQAALEFLPSENRETISKLLDQVFSAALVSALAVKAPNRRGAEQCANLAENR
jgi:predicted short-subunit dehydrogenase-like oxidoreductase (DUF2520 family)